MRSMTSDLPYLDLVSVPCGREDSRYLAPCGGEYSRYLFRVVECLLTRQEGEVRIE